MLNLPLFYPIGNIPIPHPDSIPLSDQSFHEGNEMNQNVYVLVSRAERILNEWLVDNTDKVFEEQPEIDDARALLNEALDLMKEKNT